MMDNMEGADTPEYKSFRTANNLKQIVKRITAAEHNLAAAQRIYHVRLDDIPGPKAINFLTDMAHVNLGIASARLQLEQVTDAKYIKVRQSFESRFAEALRKLADDN